MPIQKFSTAPGGQRSKFSGSGVVHVDAALSDISIGYYQSGWIADRVMPRVPVTKESDKYFVWAREAFDSQTLVGDTVNGLRREPGSTYKQLGMTPSTDSYEAYEYGAEMAIDDRERRNADPGAAIDLAYTTNLTQAIMLDRESRVAALMTSATYLTNYTTVSGTSRWDDVSSAVSDPIANIDTWKETVRLNCGQDPNQLIMGAQVWSVLRRHPAILERFKYSAGGVVTEAQIADLVGIPQILIGTAIYNTYEIGLTYTPGYIWGKGVTVCYNPPNPSKYSLATGYQFVVQDQTTFTWRNASINSDILRVSEIADEKIVSVQAAYLALTVIS